MQTYENLSLDHFKLMDQRYIKINNIIFILWMVSIIDSSKIVNNLYIVNIITFHQ